MADGFSGRLGAPCDKNGNDLPADAPPPPLKDQHEINDWYPYEDRVEFELAEFLYKRNQMSAGDIDALMDLWAATLLRHHDIPPFADHNDLYNTIDEIKRGDVPWQSFAVTYTGAKPEENIPQWMLDEHVVWFRDPQTVVKNMLANPDFDGKFDYAPRCDYDLKGNRRWKNFMSADWAWKHAVRISCASTLLHLLTVKLAQDIIAEDPRTHGSMMVPIILGSDKTTVSVATGQNDYYPLYLSIGNVHNNVRRAHRDAVVVIAFLSLPHSL